MQKGKEKSRVLLLVALARCGRGVPFMRLGNTDLTTPLLVPAGFIDNVENGEKRLLSITLDTIEV